jgi:2-iminobutanoate/2-iminopropanoate deaminase
MTKEIVATDRAPAALGPYSQGVKGAGLLFTAMQIPLDPATGEVVGDDVAAQTARVLDNIKAILEAGKSSLDEVLKTIVYLSDMNDFPAMNAVYGQYFPDAPPARGAIEAARLPKDVLVAIEAIAVVDD